MTTTYTYDGLGRLTQESSSEGKVYSYTYDANSNRASMVVTNNGVTIESVNYTYDANNRLLTEATTLLAGSETTTYSYDDNGNLLSNMVYSSINTVVSSLVYTYDGFNQQESVSANGGTVTAHYTYNAQGIRDTKTLGVTTTEFLLDGGAVVGEVMGNGAETYLRGSNLISANGDTYYLFNGHGDVVNLSNANGNDTKTYEYDAFGVEQNIDQLDDNPFRYCGEYYDEETGTYYLRARYYDPATGRFTQEDTHWTSANSIYGDAPMAAFQREDALGLTYTSYAPQIFAIQQSGNLYVYCIGNPVDFVDPIGESIVASFLILGAIGAVISASSYVFTALSTGEQVDLGALFINAFWGFLGGGIGSLVKSSGIGALVGAAAGFLSTITTGGSLSDAFFSALIGAIAAFVPASLANISGVDELADDCVKYVLSVTTGAPVEMAGDMVEIYTENLEEGTSEAPTTGETESEDIEDLESTSDSTVDGDLPQEDIYSPQPDPPEESGSSAGGPNGCIGPIPRQICV